MQPDDRVGDTHGDAGMLRWLRELVPNLRERATWYDAPDDFIAGIEAFAACLEAKLRGHPTAHTNRADNVTPVHDPDRTTAARSVR